MRAVVAVLLLAGCVRTGPPLVLVARCTSCDDVVEPSRGMSNYRRVGDCRYEVRRGDACCLVRFDVEPSRGSKPERVATHTSDGGISVTVNATIHEQTFQPTTVSLCSGEIFTVCGEEFVCAP